MKRSSNSVLLLLTLTLLSCKQSETDNGTPELKQPSDSSRTSGEDIRKNVCNLCDRP
jgi:hypothetical protein